MYPSAINAALLLIEERIIPVAGTPSPLPPVGHSVMQLAPIQKPVVEAMLPLDFTEPAISRLSEVGAMPIPNLLPGVMPKVMVEEATFKPFSDAPVAPKDKDVPPADNVLVLFTELILKNSVPVALVILNKVSLSASGVTVTGL